MRCIDNERLVVRVLCELRTSEVSAEATMEPGKDGIYSVLKQRVMLYDEYGATAASDGRGSISNQQSSLVRHPKETGNDGEA